SVRQDYKNEYTPQTYLEVLALGRKYRAFDDWNFTNRSLKANEEFTITVAPGKDLKIESRTAAIGPRAFPLNDPSPTSFLLLPRGGEFNGTHVKCPPPVSTEKDPLLPTLVLFRNRTFIDTIPMDNKWHSIPDIKCVAKTGENVVGAILTKASDASYLTAGTPVRILPPYPEKITVESDLDPEALT
ncbi:hypothetical protein, partial [Streptomyces sp. SID12501]